MRTRAFNREVVYPDEAVVKVQRADVSKLKAQAAANERRRMRLCTHRTVQDAVHEMLIVHTPDTYVRPHKHLNRGESFHVLEGRADTVLFDDHGTIVDVIRMGDYASGCCFYYRLADPIYHTLLIYSPEFVFHETANGPFDPSQTVFAPWAPADGDAPAVAEFLRKLNDAVASFRTNKS